MNKKPTQAEAEEAVRVLIAWAGDDPARAELLDTPKRVANSYKEYFCGYGKNAVEECSKTFDNSNGYKEMVILQDINFESYCEHHLVPIIGKVAVAYIPNDKVIGLSKIARVVDIFAKRLQIQERLTIEIAEAIQQIIIPKGVGVVVSSMHHCLSTRGAYKPNSLMQTSHMMGCFEQENIRREFWERI